MLQAATIYPGEAAVWPGYHAPPTRTARLGEQRPFVPCQRDLLQVASSVSTPSSLDKSTESKRATRTVEACLVGLNNMRSGPLTYSRPKRNDDLFWGIALAICS